MVAYMQNNSTPELDNFFIKNFLKSDSTSHLKSDKNSRMDESTLQEWRKAMFQIRKKESEIDLH